MNDVTVPKSSAVGKSETMMDPLSVEYRPLVIYHGNCADGFTAAWCFWRKFGQGADYHAANHGDPPPDVTGRVVYIVDFSYSYDVLAEMSWKARRIVVLDHHKTAAEALQRLPLFKTGSEYLGLDYGPGFAGAIQECWVNNIPEIVACFDMERSGAGIAWDFVFPGEPRPPLLNHVEDRDLWRFALPNTRELQAALFSHAYSFETWDRLMALQGSELDAMAFEGAAIERKHHKDIAELVKVCQRQMEIAGHPVWAASLPYTMTSDAGHLMASDGAPFAACYWDTPNSRVFSLRSAEGGVDVSEIAKQYGGGGHRHAAGFRVPRDHALAQC